jgi:endo-1,4-beta-xylanase
LGLEVEITELGARLMLFKGVKDPYKSQGLYYSRMLEICLDNPACKGITFWGLNDTQCSYDAVPWIFPKPNEPYLFDKGMNPKPASNEIYKVLKKYYETRKG